MRRIQLFRPTYRVGEVLNELKGPLKTGWTGLGPVTQLFEQELGQYMNAKYVKMVNSATAGLHLALKLLDLKPGSEVITTPLTFISTSHAIHYENLKPVFCDVDLRTGCIDETKIEELITENTGAILLVHYSGVPANMDEINRISRTYNIPVIEDSAHALGATYKGHRMGDSTNLSVFSFHAVKACPISDGGAITTNNRLYNERLSTLRWLGIDKSTYVRGGKSDEGGKAYGWEYNVEEVGYKYHGNDMLAAVGRVSLRHLEEDLARRQDIVDAYREGLRELSWLKFVPDVDFMEANPHLKSANHLAVIRVPNKNAFVTGLKNRGIDVGCHYTPNYYYPAYKECVDKPLENTETLYREIISLPLHMKLTNADVKYIIKTIKEVWN